MLQIIGLIFILMLFFEMGRIESQLKQIKATLQRLEQTKGKK